MIAATRNVQPLTLNRAPEDPAVEDEVAYQVELTLTADLVAALRSPDPLTRDAARRQIANALGCCLPETP